MHGQESSLFCNCKKEKFLCENNKIKRSSNNCLVFYAHFPLSRAKKGQKSDIHSTQKNLCTVCHRSD